MQFNETLPNLFVTQFNQMYYRFIAPGGNFYVSSVSSVDSLG